MPNLKFIIVGHVDHGKSTLIGRLLFDTNSLPPDKMEEVRQVSKELGREVEFAFLMDHLQEEREQGITIETSQTFFRTPKREYVIIDAPGHVEFVKNMITGASQAEAALLIVDAAEGMQEQTKRHSMILSMLGIEQVIVVINKMDLIKYDQKEYQKLMQEIEGFLGSLSITALAYIPVSALRGENVADCSEKMAWYSGPTILESLDSLNNQTSSEDKSLIFPVQDVYLIDHKRISVGRIECGSIEQGQDIKILPRGQMTRVKSIEKFLEKSQRSFAGESIGIITEDSVFLDRGDIVCQETEEPAVSDNFLASIFWMSKGEYKKGEKIFLRCATQEVSCRMEKIYKRINSSTLEILEEDAEALRNLEVGEVLIKAKKPIVIQPFKDVKEIGRFVLVREENVCAGGIITK